MTDARRRRPRAARLLHNSVRLGPAVLPVGVLTLAALWLMIRQSLGYDLATSAKVPHGLSAYRELVHASGFTNTLWFSLWVAAAGTALASAMALLVLWLWTEYPGRRRRIDMWLVEINLALPHVVWSVALLAMLAPSGWYARLLHAVGLIDRPDQFPVVVNDSAGVGIIVHLVTKELPFLVLATAPLAGRRVGPWLRTAATLGASPIRRLRSVFLPGVAPAFGPAVIVVFAFALGSYEAAALLGVQRPRTLSVVALDRFRDAELTRRAEAMAISVMLALIVLVFAAVVWWSVRATYASRRKGVRS